MNRLIKVILYIYALTASLCIQAQQPVQEDLLRIDKIMPDNGRIKLSVLAIDKNGAPLGQELDKYKVYETKNGVERQLTVLDMKSYNKTKEVPLHILYLLDVSSSMRIYKNGKLEDKLNTAKEAIKTSLEDLSSKGINTLFATFANHLTPITPVNINNYDKTIGLIKIKNWQPRHGGSTYYETGTILNFSLTETIQELQKKEGDKVIILLTDGRNDVRNYSSAKYQEGAKRIHKYQVFNAISSLDSSFRVYPIGIGSQPEESFLESLCNRTVNPNDDYSTKVDPSDLKVTIKTVTDKINSNCQIYVEPHVETAICKGEYRNYRIDYKDSKLQISGDQNIALGSDVRPINIRKFVINPEPGAGRYFNLSTLIIGILIVCFLLTLFYFSVNFYGDYKLRKKHLFTYKKIKKDRITGIDPLTNNSYQLEDKVVVFEDKMITYKSWKEAKKDGTGFISNGYSHFFQYHIKGNFFSQKGAYKRLNWIWFGVLAGLLTWFLDALLSLTEISFLMQTLEDNFDKKGVQRAGTIYLQMFVGLFMGIGLGTCLSFVEELGQSRKVSISRVGLRVFIGAILGTVSFFFLSILTTIWLPIESDYCRMLITWTIFGVVLGGVISIQSSITTRRGLIAGLIAGVIAFQFYYLFTGLLVEIIGVELARLLGYMIYGGILGGIIIAVVHNLEEFEIKYLPTHASTQKWVGRTVSISKWLNTGDPVYIGSHPKSIVYVKWWQLDQFVKPRHAELFLDKNAVYIKPLEQVYLNGSRVPINGATELHHGDKIQLGENSYSVFQFISKKVKSIPVTDNVTINTNERMKVGSKVKIKAIRKA